MSNFLTTKDLNEFKLELNKFNDILTVKSKKMLILKSKFANGEVDAEKVKVAEEDYNKSKEEFINFKKTNKFKENYFKSKEEIKSFKKGSKEYWDFYKELSLALNLYKESKIAIRERGKTAELSKLNNIAIKMDNIKFRYREEHPFAVNDVSLEINHGEYVAVIGHNGSGKSTLSKLIIGVLRPTMGTYNVFGNSVTINNLTLIRKFLGIVFQNPDNQFIGSTVRDDIAFGLENRRISPSKMGKIILEASKKVGMQDFLDHEPLMLSGGQKQRVAIASALALSPDIIIFDEATSMLDPKGKSDIKNIMVELKNTREKTIISITHDMDEILNADKVLVMNAGKLVKFGTPSEVLGDKEFLRSIHLDIPFLGQMEEALEEVGIKLSPSSNIEELVEKLCKK